MKTRLLLLLLTTFSISTFAQQRAVKVDFESGTFKNNPTVPYDEPFLVEGMVKPDIEYVRVTIFEEDGAVPLHQYNWNRSDYNNSEQFSITIPMVLSSNTEYDFRVATYKRMSVAQKQKLADDLRKRISFYLSSNFQFDGKNVSINKPKQVQKGLDELIHNALGNYISKNGFKFEGSSDLVFQELEQNRDFKFSNYLRRSSTVKRDSIATGLLNKKVNQLSALVLSEVMPFINSDLVQFHREAVVHKVSTDKGRKTLPINVGVHAVIGGNDNYIPGFGISIPFKSRVNFLSKSKKIDSFGLSVGLLTQPYVNGAGEEFVTPGLNMPAYIGLGFRTFQFVRVTFSGLLLQRTDESKSQNIRLEPLIGISLELDLWLGVKK